jgi:DNA-directed RNA polymerase subunit M/transcription elongation factor TFIIS
MDIIFDCPNCNQELAVDSSGAGTEIECPSCGETIAIPMESTKSAPVVEPAEESAPSLAPSTISSSAAAKVEMHLKVPVSDKPGASLIKKPAVPLSVAAKRGDKQLRIHTIRHSACIESGHDKFDEKVSQFLNETGEANITGIHTISYTYFDVGTQKILNDYGVLVVYRG